MTIDDLALTLHPELGCRTAIHLLECCGSAEAVFAASAGELVRRAELKPALARSLCQRAHLYLWDEPLNYIDLFSRIQIEDLLLDFQPTLLFVEHDQMFRQKIATNTVKLRSDC